MRCKVHPFELGPGVCAPCLRERLLALLTDGDTCPSPLRPAQQAELNFAFPRSVSPYVAHRRSVDDCGGPPRRRGRREHLFFSTPQIGPSKEAAAVAAPEVRRKLFPVLSALFRSSAGGGSREAAPAVSSELGFERNWRDRDESPSVAPVASAQTRHGSWFSALIKWRRGKSSSGGGADERERRKGRASRGDLEMMEVEEEENRHWESPHRSEHSTGSFSSPAWRIPAPTPLRQHRNHRNPAGGLSGAVLGFAVCLSPLVRPGPQKKSQVVAGDVPSSGELRPLPALKHSHCRGYSGVSGGGSTAPAVLRQNRSRKLADLGRFR